jgi:predicted nucleotidyltransferase
MPNRFKSLLEILAQADVRFILIGGVAANLHGSARATFDIDDLRIRCATADQLIFLKNAAGRPKDFESVAELRAIQEEREKQ